MKPKFNNIEEIANEYVDTQIKECPTMYDHLCWNLDQYVKDIPDFQRRQMLLRYSGKLINLIKHRDFDDDEELELDLYVHLDDVSKDDKFTSELAKEVICNPKIGISRMRDLVEGEDDPTIWLFHNECNMDEVLDAIRYANRIMEET